MRWTTGIVLTVTLLPLPAIGQSAEAEELPITTIQNPTVIAFWEPQSNAALESDPNLAAALDDQQFYWSQTRELLGELGITALGQSSLQFRMLLSSGELTFAADADSSRFGYLLVTPEGDYVSVYRVRYPAEILAAARSFFKLP